MEYRVSYEQSLANAPDDFIGPVASQPVDDIPANIHAPCSPKFIADPILKRSPQIGRIRDLTIL